MYIYLGKHLNPCKPNDTKSDKDKIMCESFLVHIVHTEICV